MIIICNWQILNLNSSPGWYNIGHSNLTQLSNAALTWMVSVSPKKLLTRRTAWRPHSFSPLRQLKIAPANRYNPTSVIPQEMYTEAKATALGFRWIFCWAQTYHFLEYIFLMALDALHFSSWYCSFGWLVIKGKPHSTVWFLSCYTQNVIYHCYMHFGTRGAPVLRHCEGILVNIEMANTDGEDIHIHIHILSLWATEKTRRKMIPVHSISCCSI